MTTLKRQKVVGSGRRRGTPNKCNAALREIARQHTQQAVETLVNIMRNSTNDGARLRAAVELLDRGHGRSSREQAEMIDLPQNAPLADQVRAVLHAIATKELGPTQGAALLAGMSALSKIQALDDLAKRIERLEKNHEHS